MKRSKCRDCYFYEQCRQDEACEYFVPITEKTEDEIVIELIGDRRNEYYAEWNQYIIANQN